MREVVAEHAEPARRPRLGRTLRPVRDDTCLAPVVDLRGTLLWLTAGAACSVAAVAALRWGVDRPVRSPWLLSGLLPPVAFEAWLLWPLLVG